jgi:hypothetical protein
MTDIEYSKYWYEYFILQIVVCIYMENYIEDWGWNVVNMGNFIEDEIEMYGR